MSQNSVEMESNTIVFRCFLVFFLSLTFVSKAMIFSGEVPSPQRQSNDGEEMINDKKDVSIEERQAIIDELQRNKDEKIKNMEEIMNSIDDLAEKSQSSFG